MEEWMLSPKSLKSLIGQQHPFHSSFMFFIVFCTIQLTLSLSLSLSLSPFTSVINSPHKLWLIAHILTAFPWVVLPISPFGSFPISCMHSPYSCHSRSRSKSHSLNESRAFCLEMSWVVCGALSIETLGQKSHFLHSSNVKPQKYGNINLYAKSPSLSSHKYNGIKKRVWGS